MAQIVQVPISCLCGKASFTASLDKSTLPRESWLCHCDPCRRTHGTLCSFRASWPAPPERVLANLTEYESSAHGKQYFCTTCGTQMLQLSGNKEDAEQWAIATGVIDLEAKSADSIFEFVSSCSTPETKDGGFRKWVASVNGKPLEERNREDHCTWNQAEVSNKNDTSREQKDLETEKLYCHCHCKGVEFFISKPAAGSESKEHFTNDQALLERVKHRGDRWRAGNCTCRSCRLASGCDITSFVFIPISHVTLADGSTFKLDFGTSKLYHSSPGVTRTFCARCGASVFFFAENYAGALDVHAGLLNDQDGARAERWLSWQTRVDFEEEAIHKGLLEAAKVGLKRNIGSKDK